MSVEKATAKKQAEAWETLVSVLPVILSAENSKDHVKSNFKGIDKACTEFGQTPDAVFGRLKRMSSAIVRQAKHEKVKNEADGSSSDSSDDDQPLKFTIKAVKPKSTQPVKAAKGRSCDVCGGQISKNSKGLCRDCHNNRGKLTSSKQAGQKKHKKGENDICVQCMEDRVIVENGLCEECYGEGADNQDREPNESADDGEVPSTRKAIKEEFTDDEEVSSDQVPAREQKSVPAKGVKKSTTSASITKKRDRKTAKCMDCQAPVHPKSKRCMDCHKISLKTKPGDVKLMKEKVEEDQVKSASSGKLKMTLKRSAIEIGRKSNESSKKSRTTYD